MRAFPRRYAGFTLVELLVVIAIIVVLSAILFPVLASARNSARKTECLNHMHNIGRAMGLYVADHYGYFPPWCQTHPDVTNAPSPKDQPDSAIVTWDLCLGDYLDAPQGPRANTGLERWQEVFRCPGNPLPGGVSGVQMGIGATWETARGYALARQTQRPQPAGSTNFYGGYAAMIPNPSETVMIFEKGANLPGSWGDALGENVNQSHSDAAHPPYSTLPFHMGGKNILFVDGSVRWYLKGTGPFARSPVGSPTGAGACERWGLAPAGDWPPLS